MADTSNGATTNSLGGLFDKLLDKGTEIFKSATGASAAKKTANASITESLASVAKSKYTLITVGLIVVGFILWRVFKKK